MRPRPRAACRCGAYLGGADATLHADAGDPDLRRRRARRPARRHPGLHGRLPGGARASPRRCEWTAEVYRARRRGDGRARRCSPASPTRAAGGRTSRATRRRSTTLVEAIERAGYAPGEQVAIALDIAASEFGRGGRYTLGLDGRELDSDGMIELLLGWIDALPDRLDRGPARPRTTPRASRASPAPPATGCRSSATTSSSPTPARVAERRRARRLQRRAAQAEPARHADRDARRPGRGARRRLRRHRLGALGRDRGRRRSSTSPSAGAPASSRSARSRAASAWRSGTRRCGSRSASGARATLARPLPRRPR